MSAVSGKVSDLDTKVLETAEKVSQPKTSVPLSLAEDVSELVVQELIPDDVIFDVTASDDRKIDEKDTASESVTAVAVHGSFSARNMYNYDNVFLNLMPFSSRSSLFAHYFFHDTFPEQFAETQKNLEALPGGSGTVIAELPESGLEVTWLKDNIPLCMTEGNYEAINKDCSYQLIIPEVTTDDGGEYKVRGGEYESTVSLTVNG